MALAFVIVLIVAGIFFLLWQDEHEKRIKAEKEIKNLKRQLKRGQKQVKAPKRPSGFATIEKSKGMREYVIKKPQPEVIKPLLDQNKLVELKKQTQESQEMLADIFVQEEDVPITAIERSYNGKIFEILSKLFEKEVWTRSEIAELAGPDVMIGSLLEQINDYSCSKVDDIVVEEDGDIIYVTTEYKTQLI